jgi:hypothetical protein
VFAIEKARRAIATLPIAPIAPVHPPVGEQAGNVRPQFELAGKDFLLV